MKPLLKSWKVTSLPIHIRLSNASGALSVSGSHALYGFNYIKPDQAEKTIAISAAGNIGIIVGQLAKINGLRVVGIAGGQDKCDKLVKELDMMQLWITKRPTIK